MGSVAELPKLSDGLAALIRTIEPTRSTGLVMTRRNVETLLDGLRAMLDEARSLEAAVDRAQWNEKARREADRTRFASIEAGLADGTVTVLPVVPRGTASQGGAAS